MVRNELEIEDQSIDNQTAGVQSRSLESDEMQIHSAVMRAALIIMLPGLGMSGADAQQTIVGKWAISSKCATPLSTIVIGPLALSGEDFYCKFDKVTRSSDTVQWNGKCNFSENGDEPAAVTAQLRGRRLYYRFKGIGWNGPFDRCQ